MGLPVTTTQRDCESMGPSALGWSSQDPGTRGECGKATPLGSRTDGPWTLEGHSAARTWFRRMHDIKVLDPVA